jgi:hypothetical protein
MFAALLATIGLQAAVAALLFGTTVIDRPGRRSTRS